MQCYKLFEFETNFFTTTVYYMMIIAKLKFEFVFLENIHIMPCGKITHNVRISTLHNYL